MTTYGNDPFADKVKPSVAFDSDTLVKNAPTMNQQPAIQTLSVRQYVDTQYVADVTALTHEHSRAINDLLAKTAYRAPVPGSFRMRCMHDPGRQATVFEYLLDVR